MAINALATCTLNQPPDVVRLISMLLNMGTTPICAACGIYISNIDDMIQSSLSKKDFLTTFNGTKWGG